MLSWNTPVIFLKYFSIAEGIKLLQKWFFSMVFHSGETKSHCIRASYALIHCYPLFGYLFCPQKPLNFPNHYI